MDDEVVRAVLGQRMDERVSVRPEELVLFSSEAGHAGIALPVASPFREIFHG